MSVALRLAEELDESDVEELLAFDTQLLREKVEEMEEVLKAYVMSVDVNAIRETPLYEQVVDILEE